MSCSGGGLQFGRACRVAKVSVGVWGEDLLAVVQVTEVLDHVEYHVLLPVREVQALVEDGARPAVAQRVHLVLPEQSRIPARLEEVGRVDAERLREGDYLAYGWVPERPGSDILDLV